MSINCTSRLILEWMRAVYLTIFVYKKMTLDVIGSQALLENTAVCLELPALQSMPVTVNKKTPIARQVGTQCRPVHWKSSLSGLIQDIPGACTGQEKSILFIVWMHMTVVHHSFALNILLHTHTLTGQSNQHWSLFSCWKGFGVHESPHFDSLWKKIWQSFNWKCWFVLRGANMTVTLAGTSKKQIKKWIPDPCSRWIQTGNL